MKRIKEYFFKLFLVVLLVTPMMVKALPVNNTVSSNQIVLLDESEELTKEDYEEKNARLCTICIILDIIIVICIVAVVVRLIRLNSEKKNNDKN